eukprot:8748889-Lingulodinium_polyedra.AAC.1
MSPLSLADACSVPEVGRWASAVEPLRWRAPCDAVAVPGAIVSFSAAVTTIAASAAVAASAVAVAAAALVAVAVVVVAAAVAAVFHDALTESGGVVAARPCAPKMS